MVRLFARLFLPKVVAMRRLILTCGLLAVAGVLPTVASAQINNNRVGTGSTGGSSNFGSTSGFGGSTGSSGFGNSGFGNAGGFTGGLGNGGLGGGGLGGGMGTGAGGLGAMGLGGNGMGALGQNQGGGFIGGNNNQGLIGRNNQNQNGMGGMNGMMNQFGGGNMNRGQRGNLNMNSINSMFGNNNNSNANTAPPIRPRQKVAFDYPVPKGDALQTNLQVQLTAVAKRNPKLSNVLVSTGDAGEVILRGAVKTEADAKLAEHLVRFEPGVRSVRNELTFTATPEAP